MPELPEVETVRRGLAPVLEGAVINKICLHREGLRFPFPPDLARVVEGQRIKSVARRAKYLLIGLEKGQVLISHLGMSGSWRVEEIQQKNLLPAREKHDHIVFTIEHFTANNIVIKPSSAVISLNSANLRQFRISYNDPRRFGFLLLAEAVSLNTHPLLSRLGIEPLGNRLSGRFLQAAFRGKKASLKTVLLNQNIIAGLGNIYVCEALWRAQLSPLRAAASLVAHSRLAEAEALAQAIRSVLDDALRSGGSHLRNYRKTDGSLGYFQHQFQVYGRENEPCRRCGTLIKKQIISGRSSFYCGKCQK